MATKKEESAEELLAPDPFLDAANRWASWVQKRLKYVAGLLVLGLALILGIQLLKGMNERDASSVTMLLGDAIKSYDSATELSHVMTATVPQVRQAELEKVRAEFAKVSKERPGHGAGHLAKLYEADVARRAGKQQEAESLFREYLALAKPGDVLGFLAIEGAGYAAEEQGKLDDALAEFSKLAAGAGTGAGNSHGKGSFYKDFGLMHKARILEKKGDLQGAVSAYKSLVEQFPESSQRTFAEERIAALE